MIPRVFKSPVEQAYYAWLTNKNQAAAYGYHEDGFIAGYATGLTSASAAQVNSPVAAIQYALEKCQDDDDSMLFLRWWNEGEFDKIRRNFDEVPEDVFVGADPLYKKD